MDRRTDGSQRDGRGPLLSPVSPCPELMVKITAIAAAGRVEREREREGSYFIFSPSSAGIWLAGSDVVASPPPQTNGNRISQKGIFISFSLLFFSSPSIPTVLKRGGEGEENVLGVNSPSFLSSFETGSCPMIRWISFRDAPSHSVVVTN